MKSPLVHTLNSKRTLAVNDGHETRIPEVPAPRPRLELSAHSLCRPAMADSLPSRRHRWAPARTWKHSCAKVKRRSRSTWMGERATSPRGTGGQACTGHHSGGDPPGAVLLILFATLRSGAAIVRKGWGPWRLSCWSATGNGEAKWLTKALFFSCVRGRF